MPIVNLINQQSPEFNISAQGGQRNLVYLVDGLDPAQDPLVQASGFVPSYSSPYPFFGGLGMYCSALKFVPKKDDRTRVYAILTFSSPQRSLSGGVQIKTSSTSAQIPYNKDPKTGEPLKVTYSTTSEGFPVTYTDYVDLTVPQHRAVLEISRQEPGSALALDKQYSNAVNSDSWQGGDAGTWICRGIDSELISGNPGVTGVLYRVTYRFEFSEDGWESLYAFKDPITGRIPDDIKASKNNDQGIYTYSPNRLSFSALSLPNAF